MNEFPIHRAAEKGRLEWVKHLIEQGVSVDSRDVYGRTPLHYAAQHGRYEVAELLISKKCDINLKDCGSDTPVMRAVRSMSKDVAHLLLQRGAQVNCIDSGGWTLLHFASCYGCVDVVQHLVENGGADLNAATNWGRTPLMLAAELGREEVAAFLIRAGADVNHRSGADKRTALHNASRDGRSKVVQVLLEVEGLDLNPQSKGGDTPLHESCCRRHPEVVKQLLIAGADINIKNSVNETAFSIGIRKYVLTLEHIRLFVQHGDFLEAHDCERISKDPDLKELVLKDVDLCTQSLLNKFHRQSLPALFPNFAEKLPCIKKIKLNTQQMQDVENFVTRDIQQNTICNVGKASPIVLIMMCVSTLLTYQPGRKRSASPGFSDSSSLLKKPRHN